MPRFLTNELRRFAYTRLPKSIGIGAGFTRQFDSAGKWRRLVFLAFLTALILRIFYFAENVENPILYSHILDESYYIHLGQAIAAGYWLGESRPFFMDPLYGYILGFLFYFFGNNLTTVRLIQILFDCLNVVLIYAIGCHIWNRRVGIIASFIYAGYKVAFFFTLLILKATFTVTGLLFYFFVLLHSLASKLRIYQWFHLGLLAAIMTYLHANFILVAPLTIFFHWIVDRPDWSLFFRRVFLFVSGFTIMLSLGAVRNYWVSGEFLFLNTQAGRLLYTCNNHENLSGGYRVPSFSRAHPVLSEDDFLREAERRLGKHLTTREASTYWTKETLRFLIGNPYRILLLLANKIKYTSTNYEIPLNRSFYCTMPFSRMARWPLPNFAFVFALGIPGLAIAFLYRRRPLLLFIPLLTVISTVIIFCTSSRFRLPAVPFLILGSAICIVTLFEWIKDTKYLRIFTTTVIIMSLFLISHSIDNPEFRTNEELSLATAYFELGDLDKAQSVAQLGAQKYPDHMDLLLLIGRCAISRNHPSEAIPYLVHAIDVDPDNAPAYHHLGLACLHTGQPENAVQLIKKALSIDPQTRYLIDLAKAYETVGEKSQAVDCYKRYLESAAPSDPLRQLAAERIAKLNNDSAEKQDEPSSEGNEIGHWAEP
jgi:tetratricopeptide (TPR) repeat protein